jgi:hypothetical protein
VIGKTLDMAGGEPTALHLLLSICNGIRNRYPPRSFQANRSPARFLHSVEKLGEPSDEGEKLAENLRLQDGEVPQAGQ